MAKNLLNNVSVSVVTCILLWNGAHAVDIYWIGDFGNASRPAASVRRDISTEVEEEPPAPCSYRSVCQVSGCLLALPFSIPTTIAISDYAFGPLGVPRHGLGKVGAFLFTLAVSGYGFGKVGWKIGNNIYYRWFESVIPQSTV